MDFAAARHNMVECQIRANRVSDPGIVAAMEELPRELFLPKPLRGIAYIDEDIAIGNGRYLMEPMVLARLLQAAEAGPNDVALDIGCGNGYGAALLARLASTVVAVESDAALARQATEILGKLGIDTVSVCEGPLDAGWPDQAPYDVIVIEGAVAEVPDAICRQLGEGGRLVTVIAGAVGNATLITRHHGVLGRRTIFDASTPVLPGLERRPAFEF